MAAAHLWQQKSLYGRKFMDRAHEVSDWRRAKVAKRRDDVKVDGHADEMLAAFSKPA